MRCPGCGAEQAAGNRFCEECGTRLGGDAAGPTPRRGRLESAPAAHLAGVSDPGPARDHNEDHLCLAVVGDAEVLVVCDGVSNSQRPAEAAQVAAAAACSALAAALREGTPLGLGMMRAAVGAAEAAVVALPFDRAAGTDPPETTLVAAVRRGRLVVLGWLGDSRAYYVGPGAARLLTQDHSWLNEVVAAGKMTADEARRSPLAHAVTRTVGGPHSGPDGDEPSLRAFEAPPGPGWLLLCTDGFWGCAAAPEAVAGLVGRGREAGDALALARRLAAHPYSNGGRDNVTVAALALGSGRPGGNA